MEHDPIDIQQGLEHIAKNAPELLHPQTGKHWRQDVLAALAYIAYLEEKLDTPHRMRPAAYGANHGR
jgi:hypothetical protein